MKTFRATALIFCIVSSFSTASFAAKNTLTLDLAKSGGAWKGKFMNVDVSADMKFKSGKFVVKNKTLASGELVADMTSIHTNTGMDEQIASEPMLNTKKYPTAEFKLTDFTELHPFAPGGPNARVKGKLTFKGKTKPVSGEFVITPDGDGFHIVGKFKTVYGELLDGEISYQIWAKK